MSRPLRIEYPNAFYHVMNRGASRQAVYLTDDDYKIFLETLKETSKIFSLRIIAYSLMPNHYHLLVQTPKANLSKAMRYLNGVYTQRFNRNHKKDGPLFRGRYKAILVQEDEYLTHLIRYIHLNPVQANLAEEALNHPFSSHKHYLRAKNEGDWLFVLLGLSFFSSKTRKALKAYRQFMKNGVDARTKAFYNKKHQNPILGDPDFLDHIKANYILADKKLDSEMPDERKLSGSLIAERIIREISKSFSKPRETLLSSKRGETNTARLAALSLTRELSGLKLSEIAPIFNIRSYRTVGSGCYRLRKMISENADLKKRYLKIQTTCSQGKT